MGQNGPLWPLENGDDEVCTCLWEIFQNATLDIFQQKVKVTLEKDELAYFAHLSENSVSLFLRFKSFSPGSVSSSFFCHESIFNLLWWSILLPTPPTSSPILFFQVFLRCNLVVKILYWFLTKSRLCSTPVNAWTSAKFVIRPDEYWRATRGTRAESTFCRLSEKLVQVQPSVTCKPFNLLFP